MKEFLSPETIIETLKKKGNFIAVFGGTSVKENDVYYQQAFEAGRSAALNGFGVISGGGPGIMEAANKGCLLNGGLSAGACMYFGGKFWENDYIDKDLIFPVEDMPKRKKVFYEACVAFIVCPGGFGTMDEFFECITLMQTGNIEKKPVVVLNKEFYTPMYQWIKTFMNQGESKLVKDSDLQLFATADSADEAIEIIKKSLH